MIGFVYYMPAALGQRWAAAAGRDLPGPDDVNPLLYIGSVVVALLVAYVLALLLRGLGGASLADGLMVGFLVWLGFGATTSLNSVLYEGRSREHWAINNGFLLLSTLAMGAIIGYLGP